MPRTTRASTKKPKQPKASRKNASPPAKPSSKDAPSSLHKTPTQAAAAPTTAADGTTAAIADTAPSTTTAPTDAADIEPTPPTDADGHGQAAAAILALLRPTTALLAGLSTRLETALAAIAEGAASEADAVEGVLAGFVAGVGELDEVHGEVAGLLEERGRGCGWDGEELGRERERWNRVVGGVLGCVSGWGEDVSEGGDEEEEEWVWEEEGEEEGDEWLEDEEWGGKGKGKRRRGKGNGRFGEEDEKVVVRKRKTEESARKVKAAERKEKGGKKGYDKEDTVVAQVEEMKEGAPAKVEVNEEDVRQQKRDSIDEFEIDWDI